MTEEHAKFIKKLRVEDEESWRGVSYEFRMAFPDEKNDYGFPGNQFDGMDLCDQAAKFFGEDYMKEPWN